MSGQERLERKLVEIAIEAGESSDIQHWKTIRDVLVQLKPQLLKFPVSLRVFCACLALG